MPYLPPVENVVALPVPARDERGAMQAAERMAGQLLARANVAALHQVQQLQRLERVIHAVSRAGFVPLSFTAHALEPPTITVEPPDDGLIDALEHRYSICGKFQRDGSTLWMSIDGVRVQWHFEPAGGPGGGERRAA